MANKKEVALERLARAVASEADGARFVRTRVKDVPRLEDKLRRGKRAEEIGDYLGGRIEFKRPSDLSKLIQSLERRGVIVDLEDFLRRPRKGGYRAVHAQVDLGNGFTAELQLVPKEVAPIMEPSHKLYEATQVPTASSKQVKQSFRESRKMFNPAWGQFLERTGQSNLPFGMSDLAFTVPEDLRKGMEGLRSLPGQSPAMIDFVARNPQLINAFLTTQRLLGKNNEDAAQLQPSLQGDRSGTYITHTPYYSMDFPVQAQSALDAYFRRGEALPREAVAQLAQVWRAQSPQPLPLRVAGSATLVRGDRGGVPFWDWVNGLKPRERVYIPRMPR